MQICNNLNIITIIISDFIILFNSIYFPNSKHLIIAVVGYVIVSYIFYIC